MDIFYSNLTDSNLIQSNLQMTITLITTLVFGIGLAYIQATLDPEAHHGFFESFQFTVDEPGV